MFDLDLVLHALGVGGGGSMWVGHIEAAKVGHFMRVAVVTRLWSHATRHSRHTSRVTRHTSHVTRHTSHVTRHTSHVTRHTSHVTRHTSHATQAARVVDAEGSIVGCRISCLDRLVVPLQQQQQQQHEEHSSSHN
jgi:hypothetical protein